MKNKSLLSATIALGFLCFGALLFFISKSYISKSQGANGELFILGEVTKLEILWAKERIELKKDKTWQVVSFNEKPLQNPKANGKFINHVLDELKSIAITPIDSVDEVSSESAETLGLQEPSLAINAAWETPREGEASVIFGTLNDSNNLVALFLPQFKKVYKITPKVHRLLQAKGIRGLLDTHMTSFTTDDVETFSTEGHCKEFAFERNGDHWIVQKGSLSAGLINDFLDQITTATYDQEITSENHEKPVCKITLTGRNNRKEEIQFFKELNGFSLSNSSLSGHFSIAKEKLTPLLFKN